MLKLDKCFICNKKLLESEYKYSKYYICNTSSTKSIVGFGDSHYEIKIDSESNELDFIKLELSNIIPKKLVVLNNKTKITTIYIDDNGTFYETRFNSNKTPNYSCNLDLIDFINNKTKEDLINKIEGLEIFI